jgi:hypothetical protein
MVLSVFYNRSLIRVFNTPSACGGVIDLDDGSVPVHRKDEREKRSQYGRIAKIPIELSYLPVGHACGFLPLLAPMPRYLKKKTAY